MDKLKPCPFCGYEGWKWYDTPEMGVRLGCIDCETLGPKIRGISMKDAWNTRVEMSGSHNPALDTDHETMAETNRDSDDRSGVAPDVSAGEDAGKSSRTAGTGQRAGELGAGDPYERVIVEIQTEIVQLKNWQIRHDDRHARAGFFDAQNEIMKWRDK